MDYGHELTEKKLKALEKRLSKEYSTAYRDMKKKADDYFIKFEERDRKKIIQLNRNEITKKEYLEWRKNQMLINSRWQRMCSSLAVDMSRTNQIAAGMIKDGMIDAYIDNVNFGAYEVASGINMDYSFTLYNRFTVSRMMKDGTFPVPPKPDIPKDMLWNRRKINSAILQGVLQGESIPKISNRLQKVTDMNRNSAIRNARTYITGAENRGRQDSYRYAESIGVDLEQMWLATLDGRTRDSHRHLDGMTRKIGEEFPNGCEYPGDPDGPAEEIYNCRCSLVADIKGFNTKASDLSWRNTSKMNGMTYSDWQEEKRKKKNGKKES